MTALTAAELAPHLPSVRARRARGVAIIALRLLGLAVAIGMVPLGIQLRQAVWEWSAPIRFRADIGNGWRQGQQVVREACAVAQTDPNHLTWPQFVEGLRHRYLTVEARGQNDRYSLDYTPARLAVMSVWSWHVMTTMPGAIVYQDSMTPPLLRFNTGVALASTVFMFLLVWTWKRREMPGETPWLIGLLAAGLFWFNPALLVDAQMWPQWDSWLLPWFLAALWLASIEWWFMAGVCIATASMFKGQVLMAAPFMFLWPLFAGKFGAGLRWIAGLVFGIAGLAALWLVTNVDAAIWVGSVFLAVAIAAAVGRRRRWRNRMAWPLWSVIPLMAIAAWPLLGTSRNDLGLIFIAAVGVTPWIARRLNRSGTVTWTLFILASAILLAANPFGGSWSWLIVGYFYPTYHFPQMSHGCSNLPEILGESFGWNIRDVVFTTPSFWKLPAEAVTMKSLLITIYSVTLILCAAGAAKQARRRSGRILLCFTAPWVLMFTILPQMHERYLMWGAATGVMVVGTSLGVSLLQGLVIVLASVSIYKSMLLQNVTFTPVFRDNLLATVPGSGWMLMLLAAVYLFLAVSGEKIKPVME